MRATEKTRAVAAKEARIRMLESELQVLKAAEDDTICAEDADGEDAIQLRMLPTAKEAHHFGGATDAERFGAMPAVNMDPCACLCRCKFKRIGQSYVLHESRAIKHGEVHTNLVIVGPHWIGVVVTLAILLVATGAFLTQQCTRLSWHYTLVTLAFCLVTLYYLFETSCRDPGILYPHYRSRDTKDGDAETEQGDEQMESGQARSSSHEQQSDLLLSQRSSTALVTPSRLPTSPTAHAGTRTRMCDICGVLQDQYTEHCDDCDVCIDEYDHHCPWMGKCIGGKNLRAFKLFNLSWVLYVVFVLAVAIQNVEWTDMAIQRLERTTSGSWVPVPSRSQQP